MKWIILLLTGLLASCSTSSPTATTTAEDEAQTHAARTRYVEALKRSVANLDDGVTPANEVGRAAIYASLPELRAWRRAATAHLVNNERDRSLIEPLVNRPPSEQDLATATSLVLRARRS
jgi:hypothetical protein